MTMKTFIGLISILLEYLPGIYRLLASLVLS